MKQIIYLQTGLKIFRLFLIIFIAIELLSCGEFSVEYDGKTKINNTFPNGIHVISVSNDAETNDESPANESPCNNECDTGHSQCSGNTVQVCELDGSGCAKWNSKDNCEGMGKICSIDGEGNALCINPGITLESKGIWVWGSSIRGNEQRFMSDMASHNISDVFLLIKGTSGQIVYDVMDRLTRIRDDQGYDIKIWAWIIIFNDESYNDDFDTNWVDPQDESYRTRQLQLIEDTLRNHKPDGIMLDCIRYPGNASNRTEPITSFCADVRTRVNNYNSSNGDNVLIGAAVMPEFGANESVYGQDVEQMALYLDVIAPMVYRYNYSSGTSWITSMTRAAIEEAGSNADVWPILQNYKGDDSPTPLNEGEMLADIRAAMEACPTGFSIFQYNLLNSGQWSAIDQFHIGDIVCQSENPEPSPSGSNLDFVKYHQQPLSSNDGGPFYSGSSYEGWCNTASLYMVLHSFIPDLPQRLRNLDPSWRSWRGGGLPAEDSCAYNAETTYNVEEFLQERYLGYIVGTSGIGFSEIQRMMEGVGRDLGFNLVWEYIPLSEMRNYLLNGWLAIMNNWEWGGHYFVVVWYEAGSDPSDPSQRFYYILDPTNIESGNDAILSHINWERTNAFRNLITSRQPCCAVDCSRDNLGIYVLDANGVNAIYRGAQYPGHVPMIKLN